MNRLWQFAFTFPVNLSLLKDDEQLVIVDYGSSDGLEKYLYHYPGIKNLLSNGQIKIVKVQDVSVYDCSKAKNLAHRMADAPFLMNLDADNYLQGVRVLLDEHLIDGDRKVAHLYADVHDGTFGRIGMAKEWFYALGGYDESFLPHGYQDSDILARAALSGISINQIVDFNYLSPVPNNYADKAANTGYKSWLDLKCQNQNLSLDNLSNGKFIANLTGWGSARVNINFSKSHLDLEPIIPINCNP
jgi:hypothetical protein